MRKFSPIVALLSLAVAASAAPMRTISVSGAGQVAVVPNIAQVSLSFKGVTAADKTLVQVTQDVNAKAGPAIAEIKSLVGKNGAVSVTSSVQNVYEYNQETHKNEFKGQALTTLVSVTLRGKKAVADKLGALYDSSVIKADEISAPSLSLSERTQAAANRAAYKKAVADARNEAQAQLLPGERLGKAIHRGNTAAPAVSHRGGARMAMAMTESVSDSSHGGAAIVEIGKITVRKATNFFFEILGRR